MKKATCHMAFLPILKIQIIQTMSVVSEPAYLTSVEKRVKVSASLQWPSNPPYHRQGQDLTTEKRKGAGQYRVSCKCSVIHLQQMKAFYSKGFFVSVAGVWGFSP